MSWAKNWDYCQECGTVVRPHFAKGLCKRCYMRKWKRDNPDKVKAGARKYYREHKEERQTYNRQWELEHREERRAYNKQWKANHPVRRREQSRRYRARKANVAVEQIDEQAIFGQSGHTCVYCGDTEDLTLDHVIPINAGGPHCPGNLVTACKSCNSSKGDMPVIKWLRIKIAQLNEEAQTKTRDRHDEEQWRVAPQAHTLKN